MIFKSAHCHQLQGENLTSPEWKHEVKWKKRHVSKGNV